jgi:hypothetical protein
VNGSARQEEPEPEEMKGKVYESHINLYTNFPKENYELP